MAWQVLQGDCVERLKELPDACLDALVTDPPYGLSRDLRADELAQLVRAWLDGEHVKVNRRGFMGKAWDAFVPAPHIWREVLRVLKPGAHAAVFAGSRTVDLMGLSLRLAGFELRDSIMLAGWLYGSGFPKSLNLGDGVGTALKPAFEPVLLLRKPLADSIARTRAAHGTGGLNIDACRVPSTGEELGRASGGWQEGGYVGGAVQQYDSVGKVPDGRWPANLVLVHAPSCAPGACVDECPTRALDEQSGMSRSRVGKPRASAKPGDGWGMTKTGAEHNDSGGASRYFSQFFYCPKADRKEREQGCEQLPAKSGADAVGRNPEHVGVNNPRAGAGARLDEVRNWHPTVKPLALMRWLVRLVTPAAGVVLDPFAGSGTTLAAAVLEHRDALGVELGEGEAEIARARAAFWEGKAA